MWLFLGQRGELLKKGESRGELRFFFFNSTTPHFNKARSRPASLCAGSRQMSLQRALSTAFWRSHKTKEPGSLNHHAEAGAPSTHEQASTV